MKTKLPLKEKIVARALLIVLWAFIISGLAQVIMSIGESLFPECSLLNPVSGAAYFVHGIALITMAGFGGMGIIVSIIKICKLFCNAINKSAANKERIDWRIAECART